MSEADKIIESLKNSGRKVEEFYTGNKTSDKNVANIEKDIKNIKQYINLVLDKNYCDCNELNVISTGKHCDGSKNVAYSMQNILAELEQKDKRIQELEGENRKIKAQHVFTRRNEATDEEKAELYDVIEKTVDEFLEKEKTIWEQKMTTEKMSLEEAINVVDAMYQDRYKIIEENDTVYVDRLKDVKFTNLEFASVILLRGIQSLQSKLNNSIPKQVVIDKIEELMIQGNYKTFYNPNGRTHFLKEESDCKIEVLQELLGGEKNNENIKS